MTKTYAEIGRLVQLQNKGVKISDDTLNQYQLERPTNHQEGIATFNQIAEKEGLYPMHDPVGYMTLDNNVWEYLHEAYDSQFKESKKDSQHGLVYTSAAYREMSKNLGKYIRRDFTRSRALRNSPRMKSSDLRFVEMTPRLETEIGMMVKARALVTSDYTQSRSVSGQAMDSHRMDFNRRIRSVGRICSDIYDGKEERQYLSAKHLKTNAIGVPKVDESLAWFAKKMQSPDAIELNDQQVPTGSLTTRDRSQGQFLLRNAKYLETFNMQVTRGRREVSLAWQSPTITEQYEKMQTPDITLDRLSEEKNLSK